MSKNIKIGRKVYQDVEYISCDCADEEGVERLYQDVTSTESGLPLTPATADTLGGVKVGQNLDVTDDGVLSVKTTDTAEEYNTKPITSAGVYAIVGNIDVLLKAI